MISVGTNKAGRVNLFYGAKTDDTKSPVLMITFGISI